MTRIQLAHRDDGTVVRIVAENHEILMSTGAQLYADDRDALIAITLVASTFGTNARVEEVVEGQFELVGYDAEGAEVSRVPLERVDERTQAGDA